MLPLYLLALAAFLFVLNVKAARTPTKFLSYIGMWVAVGASAFTAFQVYT